MSNNTYPKDDNWIIFPKTKGLALYVSWVQGQEKVKRREKYFLVNCYFSASEQFTGTPGSAPLWVADVFFEPHFAEEHNLLQGISKPKDHIYKFDEVGEHWVKAKLDKRFFYGQDKAGSGTTFRWIVYHPPSWEPKQANFGQNGFTTIAADLVSSSVKSLTSAGLKIADPSGLLNAGVINLVGWEKLGNDAKGFANSYGDPLRRFGEHSLTEAQEKQLKFDQGEYNASFGIVWDQMKQDSRFCKLPEIQQKVLSTAMVALNLGVQGTAEEGAHHSTREFLVNPSPFAK